MVPEGSSSSSSSFSSVGSSSSMDSLMSSFRLTLGQRLAYGVGHVQNDLFAAMWFSYILLYLQFVVQIPVTTAGLIFLIGQFCDGIITPLIAYETDKLNWSYYGKRKTAHLIGTLVISLTFPFVFTRIPGLEESYWGLVTYFVVLSCLFQCGWAAVQVSHLSLIPELTPVPRERDELNIIRYAFDILTDTAVYVITYLVLIYYNMDSSVTDNVNAVESSIGPESAVLFQNIAIILLVLGLVFTTVYHVFTPEEKGKPRITENSTDSFMIWSDWFKVGSFYKISILFSMSRVITNILQAFIPLYLQEGVQAPPYLIATIPLIVNLSGFFSSLLVKPIIRVIDKRTLFMIAACLAFSGGIWFAWDSPREILLGNVYGIAILSGVGGSTMLVLALSFAADLIGQNTVSSGFVYGCMAFSEKIVNGLVILAFQAGRGLCTENCSTYYRDVLCYGICFFVIVNLVTVLSLTSKPLDVQKSLLLNVDEDEEEILSSVLLNKTGKSIKYGAMKTGFPLFSKSLLKDAK